MRCRRLRLCAAAAVLSGLAACAASPPEGAPRVRIEGLPLWHPAGGFTQAAVCAVDGRALPSCATVLELAPGRHELELRLWGLHHWYPVRAVVACDFPGPGTYELGGLTTASGMLPWIRADGECGRPRER